MVKVSAAWSSLQLERGKEGGRLRVERQSLDFWFFSAILLSLANHHEKIGFVEKMLK
jgi:hypothetical protein